MAFDAFLKIDGIPGESTDDKHKDWIEVLSFDFGMDAAVLRDRQFRRRRHHRARQSSTT